MASNSQAFLILLYLTQLVFLLTNAQTPLEHAGPINLTNILARGGQFNTFIRLLNQTQVSNQITNLLNSSTEGLTVFAPTDHAFLNLPAGTLNGLSVQQQVQLVLNHVLPKYYSLVSLQTVSNPVPTQATGQDGKAFGLYIANQGEQFNVSSGVVEAQINNTLRKRYPLAVYSIDRVLFPLEFTEAKPPKAATPFRDTPSTGGVRTLRQMFFNVLLIKFVPKLSF